MAFQPKGPAKTNAQRIRQQNQQAARGAQGQQFGTEFASETNAQQVQQQNRQAAQGAGAAQGQQQFGTEFASETNTQQVRQQNQKAEAQKQQNQK
ncbi:gamma-type small acid-soluble spore protein [Kroppenstedtia eburnea]|uniref:gamma-type small acid-soluble spore protein n=1 Tax=Kroppenstedtia eburnea TaxID=714067 RepID=UPI0009315BED|nr:gamma-type small acid-soluble spore protein [Kroppenstedtia eburnea]QKI82961.1 gamma-type small acid-soluble spore protein [Kroppenstedtia eburnea]